ncbi:MAG TPA: glucose-1-phosphate adenylyltransferase [Syntrophaceae bacterium]|nr:glucose-1-phosphate adenylyltransferase [Syntrophaceae bacterium]
MKVLTMILAGGKGERLYPLTRDRAKPAVPFGGIYRIIDFTLSNCVNSYMKRILILTQYRSFSLEKHIQLGWNILCNKLGEFIHIVSAQQRIDEIWYQGTADAIYQNLYILQQERPDLVLILSGDHLYKMDYRNLIFLHQEKGADLTMATLEQPKAMSRHFGVIEVDQQQRVVRFQEKPRQPRTIPGNPHAILASMGIYVFNTEVLVRRLIEDAKQETTHDFGRDIIPSMVPRDKVFAYIFQDQKLNRAGYWRDIGTIESYWEANMDLLGASPTFDLYDPDWPIFTYDPPAPPARIISINTPPVNSIISDGCIIEADKIEHSILSPNVRVFSKAEVKDSIIMEDVTIERGAKIRKAIIDKGTVIPQDLEIGYNVRKDRKHFTVTESGIVVVTRDTRLE